MAKERLQKLMARAEYGSRRACEEIIENGRVTVNGQIASLGLKADPDVDDIRVDGRKLRLPSQMIYIMLNKPRNYISDTDVGGNWASARGLIPVDGHLYPVGRLDVQSEGLMLFTNDGELAHKLTHPRYSHAKTYQVLVAGSPSEKTLDIWRRGVMLDGKKTRRATVTKLRKTRDGTLIEVVMYEGRKRQIRRVAAALGHPAIQLTRLKLGPLELGDLPVGSWRRLTAEEIASLKAIREQREPRSQQPRKRKPQSKKQSSKKPDSRNRGSRRR